MIQLHEDLLNRMAAYRSQLDAIQAKSNTARKVVEEMQGLHFTVYV